jgi:hypothetical protein
MSLFATILLVAFATQAPPPQTNPAPTPTPVVAIGCLQSATAEGREQFTLTMKDTNAAAGEVKTITYTLNPTAAVDLKSHVGQRVEVTGTEAGQPVVAEADTTRTSTPTGTSGRTPKVETRTRADIEARQLNVTAIKMLTADCRVP